MKTIFLALFTLVIGLNAFSGNNDKEKNSSRLVYGKVIDKISGEEIAGAEVIIENKKIYTDLNGNFISIIHLEKPEISVKNISYIDAKYTVDSFTSNNIIIELASK